MILTLYTETVIDSSHNLKSYKGKCKNIHGHSWLIKLWFRGNSKLKDEIGILLDFGIVKKLKERLDHQYLNDVIGKNPTAENLVEWIYEWLQHQDPRIKNKEIKVKIRIYETAVRKETYCEGGDFQ